MNSILFFAEIVIIFSLLLLMKKLFGKTGMYVWIAIASVMANIITAKNANILGLNTAIGSVMFASTFLATDVLSECYGKQFAKKGVFIGLSSIIIFIISSQIALIYKPSVIDYASKPMKSLFGMNFQISIASVVMYFLANLADVYLFNKIKEKTDGKLLWVRNNISTILCNCLENFGFVFFGFIGIYDFNTMCHIALSVCVVEAIIGLCDTPFIYCAKKIKSINED